MSSKEIGEAAGIGLVVGFMIGCACSPTWMRKAYGTKVMLLVFMPLYVIVAFHYLFSVANPLHYPFDLPVFFEIFLGAFILGALGSMIGFIFEIVRWLYLKVATIIRRNE